MKLRSLLLLSLLVGFTAHAQVIPVETDQVGLYFSIGPKKNVLTRHLGQKLADAQELLAAAPKVTAGEAYPTFGNGNSGEPALLLTHADGNMTVILEYVSHSLTQPDEGIALTEIRLSDPLYAVEVSLFYKAYKKDNIIECWSEIRNNEKGEVKLERFASTCLTLNASEYWLTHFYGHPNMEQNMVEEKLTNGIKIVDSKRGVRTTQNESPSFILSLGAKASETEHEVMVGTLAWSNNFRLAFQMDNLNSVAILPGMNDFASDYFLAPGKKLETPKFIFAYSPSGVGQASRNLHRWARAYSLQDGDRVRDVILNSWEGASFDFDEKLILKMIDDAASMGVETFVLDDGWFGGEKYRRDNAAVGLGDWQVNREKLPGGLEALVKKAHSKGMKFGVWIEPEMATPKSVLAEKHPDWLIDGGKREPMYQRNQLLLDVTNPAVQEFMFQAVSGVLTSTKGIDYIKWDANRHVQNFGSNYLPAGKQSHFWIDYGKGLYSVMERLSKAFPDVVFQACSTGGGRVDYGTMKYMHEFWASDNTDPWSRILINWGYSQVFPAMAVGTHVSQSPGHQTRHITPIKFRFDVAMAQRLGIELQPANLTPEEVGWAKNAVAAYKGFRNVVQLGDQYRLISPYQGTQRASMIYVDEGRSHAVLFAYSFGFHFREDIPQIRLQGLDPAKKYRINEVLPATRPNAAGEVKPAFATTVDGKVFSGDFLMKHGIAVKVLNTYDSAVLELVEVK